MNLLSELVTASGGRKEKEKEKEVMLGEVARRVPTPDLSRLETVSLGVG